MAAPKLKGVCIGSGYFSQFQYEAWQRIPEVELVALCGHPFGQGETAGAGTVLPRSYTDHAEMFDVEQPDFVDIITRPPAHQAICAEATKRGIHIICQKPLGPSVAVAREIVANAAAAKVRFMVHENFRFQPWHREIKRLIIAGAIGDQLHSLTFRTRMGDGWGESAYMPRQPYFRDYPRMLVYETGVHFIDTFRFLAGDITRVTAWLRRLNPVIKGEDCGLLVFEFANGALGQWDANRFNEPACSDSEARYTFGEFLVEGSAGSLRLYPDGRLTLKKLGGDEQPVEYKHEHRGFAGDCCYTAQRHFTDCLLTGQPCETSGEEYLKALVVQEAIYESATKRAPVEVRL
jgi:predicted dehydrogenase